MEKVRRENGGQWECRQDPGLGPHPLSISCSRQRALPQAVSPNAPLLNKGIGHDFSNPDLQVQFAGIFFCTHGWEGDFLYHHISMHRGTHRTPGAEDLGLAPLRRCWQQHRAITQCADGPGVTQLPAPAGECSGGGDPHASLLRAVLAICSRPPRLGMCQACTPSPRSPAAPLGMAAAAHGHGGFQSPPSPPASLCSEAVPMVSPPG